MLFVVFFFFKINFFEKNISRVPSECQTVWNRFAVQVCCPMVSSFSLFVGVVFVHGCVMNLFDPLSGLAVVPLRRRRWLLSALRSFFNDNAYILPLICLLCMILVAFTFICLGNIII